ncbi:glycogen debranching protein [Sphingobacteriales bacterium UPWRP_1]|nr:glycogen debranching protein [Sphingobacteriales bacterium TSM_CSS]PSJ76013.1 glycogen debranching protein [Sphingobacteriales bacterium UPWRP_1]
MLPNLYKNTYTALQKGKIGLLLLFILLPLMSAVPPEKVGKKALYRSGVFTLYANKVVQGKFTAQAKTPTALTTNYQSPANSRYGRLVEFKFSINGKDNELPFGVNHRMVLLPQNGRVTTPVIGFGIPDAAAPTLPDGNLYLEPNTRFTIRLDMNRVLKAFNETGFFETANGEKIAKPDFKGVYVAGGSQPLGWDFENLPSRPQYELTDPDGDGIYEVTLVMNAYNPDDFTATTWQLQKDLSSLPQYSSGFTLPDALYNLSLEEMLLNIRSDGAYMAGEKWDGVWTRDISYSILLSLALLQPDVAKTSLLQKVKNNRIVQDTGTGGSWPISSDRMTWVLAAWEVYLSTGDKDWLQKVYPIIKNSADDDRKTLLDMQTGLMMGESSFLDWRKQSYPRWMNPVDIYRSQNLGTNAVHCQTHFILSQIENELGLPNTGADKFAQQLANNINRQLWSKENNYYGQYLYGADYPVLSARSETLGEALCILFNIADEARADEVIAHTPALPYGVPCFYPQIPDIPPYHNNAVWPFVQAYFTWAAAKAGNTAAVEHGLACIYRQAALFATNKENMSADNGDFKGTEINSDRQLWSVAGNLATVYRIFYGINLQPDGLTFTPFVPKPYNGTKKLTNFKYRNAILDIELRGYGKRIGKFTLDGQVTEKAFIPANLTGRHTVVIELDKKEVPLQPFNRVNNLFSPETPDVQMKGNFLEWQPIEGAAKYMVYQNGRQLAVTEQTRHRLPPSGNYAQYQVCAVTQNNVSSFLSKPVSVVLPAIVQRIEAETAAPATAKPCTGYSGSGAVELTVAQNTTLHFTFTAPQNGQYRFEFAYSNGSGPVNTDNKCAIRTLYVSKALPEGKAVVFPQLGFDEWSNWGMSNPITLWMDAGKHEISLQFEPHNQNMNGSINTLLLDYLEITQVR